MSVFSSLPSLDLGRTIEKGTLIGTHLTARDRFRLIAALDCYVLAKFQQNTNFDKVSVRIMGAMDTRTQIHIPPSGNIGFWPGFDLKRVAIQSSTFTTFIRNLQPHLSRSALLIHPLTKTDHPKLEREVGERILLGRQYEMPLNTSAHDRMRATAWVETIMQA